jgi:hypothetical protein
VTDGLTNAELRANPVPVVMTGAIQLLGVPRVAVPGGVSINGPVAVTGDFSGTTTITLMDEASATITYVGKAAAGSISSSAVWQIQRIDSSSGLAVLYADSITTFTKVWDSRAGYTYG